jgi:molybdenum cofactor biosynthesis enzyme MoaA
MPGLFCPRPFEHFEVQHNGKAYLCCPGWLPEPLGHVGERTPAELWNGEVAARIRGSILDGSFRYCTGCPFLGTRREPVRPREAVENPEHLAILRDQRVEIPRIRRLYLAYDRSCNLSCPSCRTAVIVAQGHELRRLQVFQDALVTPEMLHNIDWLNITGSGDPFASSLFRNLLRALNADDYPRLGIELHTNGLLFTRENWDAMSGAQVMIKRVEVSVDAATAETYAINRRGGEWTELLERLELVRRLRESGPLEHLQLSFVVQANNWREMPAFVRLARGFGADSVLFTAIRNWGTFGVYQFFCRAVHLADHPEHGEFVRALETETELRDPRVVMSDFSVLEPTQQVASPLKW